MLNIADAATFIGDEMLFLIRTTFDSIGTRRMDLSAQDQAQESRYLDGTKRTHSSERYRRSKVSSEWKRQPDGRF